MFSFWGGEMMRTANVDLGAVQKLAYLVERGKSCRIILSMPKSVSIRLRTDLAKFGLRTYRRAPYSHPFFFFLCWGTRLSFLEGRRYFCLHFFFSSAEQLKYLFELYFRKALRRTPPLAYALRERRCGGGGRTGSFDLSLSPPSPPPPPTSKTQLRAPATISEPSVSD